jgi:hypothetical protein
MVASAPAINAGPAEGATVLEDGLPWRSHPASTSKAVRSVVVSAAAERRGQRRAPSSGNGTTVGYPGPNFYGVDNFVVQLSDGTLTMP